MMGTLQLDGNLPATWLNFVEHEKLEKHWLELG
jgi:hypothetical protein